MSRLPVEWPEDLRSRIHGRVRNDPRKVVVIDDDPTGTQTVHDIPLTTEWTAAALENLLESDAAAFYILTNSRSMPAADAVRLNREIGRNLTLAARRTGRPFVVISRSDSTLRGHFPAEMAALTDVLEMKFDGWIVIPFFQEGGRITVDDVHYVRDGRRWVPAADTEFARDAVFGYASSNLRDWVAEKTGGRIPAADVVSISIDDLRIGGPAGVEEKLMRLKHQRPCIVNAAGYRDLEVFVLALLEIETRGRRFLYRTAASFVPVRAALTRRDLLGPSDFKATGKGGGLVVVGSHVPRTTRQLEELLHAPGTTGFELNVAMLLDDRRRAFEIERITQLTETALRAGKNAVVYTSRRLLTPATGESNLSIGRRVSDALAAVVQLTTEPPRFLVAKGGITASDIATRALGVKQAMVRGQILPGVPVWQLGSESRYPGLTYVVFPGNVGGPDALTRTVDKLGSPP